VNKDVCDSETELAVASILPPEPELSDGEIVSDKESPSVAPDLPDRLGSTTVQTRTTDVTAERRRRVRERVKKRSLIPPFGNRPNRSYGSQPYERLGWSILR